MSASTVELRELRAILACVRVVLYGDACEDAPCEDDECNACRSNARVDAYLRPTGGTVDEGVPLTEQTYAAAVPLGLPLAGATGSPNASEWAATAGPGQPGDGDGS